MAIATRGVVPLSSLGSRGASGRPAGPSHRGPRRKAGSLPAVRAGAGAAHALAQAPAGAPGPRGQHVQVVHQEPALVVGDGPDGLPGLQNTRSACHNFACPAPLHLRWVTSDEHNPGVSRERLN